jgi:hypothetical protein
MYAARMQPDFHLAGREAPALRATRGRFPARVRIMSAVECTEAHQGTGFRSQDPYIGLGSTK